MYRPPPPCGAGRCSAHTPCSQGRREAHAAAADAGVVHADARLRMRVGAWPLCQSLVPMAID
eukprot:scaffold115_cov304-Prasinococcus_capsulatus_cf.AAC.9